MGILKARRRIRRKVMRADKKKQKSLSEAVKRCRVKKKRTKEEETQAVDVEAGPSLYDNLMRVVILATYHPLTDRATCLSATS